MPVSARRDAALCDHQSPVEGVSQEDDSGPHFRSAQQEGSISPSAYLVLQVLPPSKTLTIRVKAQKIDSKTVECDVESMTGSQLYQAGAWRRPEPEYVVPPGAQGMLH